MRTFLAIFVVTAPLLAGCRTGGNPLVRVVKPLGGGLESGGCEYIGKTSGPEAAASEKAVSLGGDTMTDDGGRTWSVYTCDRQKAAILRSRRERIDSVRLTSTRDAVRGCTFLKNVTAESERDAREETVRSKGNVLFMTSGSSTTGDGGAGHLSGEAYRCGEPK
jgi:hypothetical protein